MARLFNATTDRVQMAAMSIPAAISIYWWSKGATNYAYLFQFNNSMCGVGWRGTGVISMGRWFATSFGIGCDKTHGANTAIWNHFCFTHDGTSAIPILYVNGVATGAGSWSPAGAVNTSSQTSAIANNPGGGGIAQNCSMAWFGMHNVVLTPTEVAEAMAYGKTARGLIVAHELGVASPEIDASGNGHDGTVTGTTVVAGPSGVPAASAISSTQAGSGADTGVSKAVIPSTQTGSGTDAGVNKYIAVSAQTGSGVDTGVRQGKYSQTDLASGVDTGIVKAVYPRTEAGSGAEATVVKAIISSTQAASGADVGVQRYSMHQFDVGAVSLGTFGEDPFGTVPFGAGGEIETLLAVFPRTDSIVGAESIKTKRSVVAQAATGTDTFTIHARYTSTDSGAGTEAQKAAHKATDSGSAIDVITRRKIQSVQLGVGVDLIYAKTPKAGTDSGTGVERYRTRIPRLTIPKYGIADGYKILTRATVDQEFELDQIVEIGADAIRIDSEPTNQDDVDTVVALADARGLKTILILFGTVTPGEWDAYPDFSTDQATKWAGDSRVVAFEIGNEPDLNGWTPATYAAWFKIQAQQIRAVDVFRTIITGGLWKGAGLGSTTDPVHFVNELCKTAYGLFEQIGMHLYDDAQTRAVWNIWDMAYPWTGGFYNGNTVRETLNSYGLTDIPIIATEAGAPVAPEFSGGYTEAQQATIVTDAVGEVNLDKISGVYIYSMMNDDVLGFGLLRTNFTKRPAWTAYQTAIGATKVSTDSGSGADLAVRAARVFDSGVSVDAVTGRITQVVETASGAEAQSLKFAQATSDSGSGVNTEIEKAAPKSTDSVIGAETRVASAKIASTQAATVVETTRVLHKSADAGSGSEAQVRKAKITGIDSVLGAETASRDAREASTQAGSGAESTLLVVLMNSTDSGSGAEGSISRRRSQSPDAGAGSDSLAERAALKFTDTASGSDIGIVGSVSRITLDAGSGSEVLVSRAVISSTQASSGGETVQTRAVAGAQDSGGSAESAVVHVRVLSVQTSTGTDTGTSTLVATPVFNTQLAAGADFASVRARVSYSDTGIGIADNFEVISVAVSNTILTQLFDTATIHARPRSLDSAQVTEKALRADTARPDEHSDDWIIGSTHHAPVIISSSDKPEILGVE